MNTEVTTDLMSAIELVKTFSHEPKVKFEDYRLIRAELLLTGSKHCSGLRCWQLTYKLTKLLPKKTTDIIGAGGELFFIVDLEKQHATFAGYGE